MRKLLLSVTSLALLGALGAAPALAEAGWDHRALRSHHQAADRREPTLAPGEKRVGRILIGAPAGTSRAATPETLETATQRQWIQRGSFEGGGGGPAFNPPRVRAIRRDGTPGVSSRSSPGR
jgi:hypothetical protein